MWLKQNASQGEGEAEDRWNNVQYRVIQQIVTDVPMCEVRAKGRDGIVIHWSSIFPTAPQTGDDAHLDVEADLSVAVSSQSTLVGFTPWGWVGETPVVIAWGC